MVGDENETGAEGIVGDIGLYTQEQELAPDPLVGSITSKLGELELPAVEVTRTEDEALFGTLKVWNVDKGFGFVAMEDGGPDLFVHQSAISVDGDRYRAILPGTVLRCVYYLREGKETAREVCLKEGGALPGFSSKLEAAQKLSLASSVAGRPGMLTGTIKFMNKDKGFGFIVPDAGGDDMFVHVGDIDGQQILNQGEPVAYTTAVKKGNRPQAVEVTPLRPRYPAYPPQRGYQSDYGYPPHGYDQQYGYPPSPYGGQDYGGEYPPAGNMHGRVKWYNELKGFGFIVPEGGGPDVYFKGIDVRDAGPPLMGNEFVTYETKSSADGKLWAGSVMRVRGGGGGKRGPKASPGGQRQEQPRGQGSPGYNQGSPQSGGQQAQYNGQAPQYGGSPQYMPQTGGPGQYSQQRGPAYGGQQNGANYTPQNGSYNGQAQSYNGQYAGTPSNGQGYEQGYPQY